MSTDIKKYIKDKGFLFQSNLYLRASRPSKFLLNSAISFSKQLSTGPTISFKEIKKIANITATNGIEIADKVMKKSIRKVLSSEDSKKGISYLDGKTKNINFKGK